MLVTHMKRLIDQPSLGPRASRVDVMGIALATNPVTVNGQGVYRKGEYFRKELSVNNAAGPVWQQVDVTAPNETTVTRHELVPKTPETFTYDADGNLVQDGRWSYTWDLAREIGRCEGNCGQTLPVEWQGGRITGTFISRAEENRLIRVESRPVTPQGSWRRVEWQYDALGRRIRQTTWDGSSGAWQVTEDLTFASDPVLFGRPVAELNATNNALVRAYAWGLDLSGSMQGAGGVGGLLSVTVPTGPNTGAYFCCYDGNGNLAALINAADGSLAAQYEYGPFGELLRSTGPAAALNPFRFSTKYQDDETGLLYYGYRYYDPSAGRWPNRDQIDEKGGLNLYGFVRNNSINRIDPFGLSENPTEDSPSCCDKTCDKEGVKFLTGEAASVYLAGEYEVGDKDVIKQMDRAIKGLLKCARGPYGYAKEPGKISEATSVAVSKKLQDFQNGTKLYTILIYNLCVKKRCKLFGQCSPMHWVPLRTEARPCKPTSAEAHPLHEDAFVDRETANAAASRCQEEHAKEFEAP